MPEKVPRWFRDLKKRHELIAEHGFVPTPTPSYKAAKIEHESTGKKVIIKIGGSLVAPKKKGLVDLD